MSNAALNAAWDAPFPKGKAGAKHVLAILGDHASDHDGEDWTCFPSIARIARRATMDERSVERHLIWLVEEGWIKRARLRRRDGTLAGYRYRLNRKRLIEVMAQQVADEEPFDWDEGEVEPLEPDDNLSGGPADSLSPATRQIVRQPPDKLSGHEPSIEPPKEPSQSARASLSPTEVRRLFDQAGFAYPAKGRKVTRWPVARKAWVKRAAKYGAERLKAAAVAYAADADVAGQNFVPGLHTWLENEVFAAFLPAEGEAAVPAVHNPFEGLPGWLCELVAVNGNGWSWARSYLDGATFDEAERVLRCRRGIQAEELQRRVGQRLKTDNIRIEGPQSAMALEGTK